MLWVGLPCVIVVFPDHTHFFKYLQSEQKKALILKSQLISIYTVFKMGVSGFSIVRFNVKDGALSTDVISLKHFFRILSKSSGG